MGDLIEREDAINEMADYIGCDFPRHEDALDCARSVMGQIPSARPKGEWIKNIDGDYECSECHVAIRGDDKPIYPFCAWCGADMREREGE